MGREPEIIGRTRNKSGRLIQSINFNQLNSSRRNERSQEKFLNPSERGNNRLITIFLFFLFLDGVEFCLSNSCHELHSDLRYRSYIPKHFKYYL